MSISNTPEIILRSFFMDDAYMRRVLPFIEPNYFEGPHKILFKQYAKYVAKYNNRPTQESFLVELQESDLNINDSALQNCMEIIPNLFTEPDIDEQWLIDNTEKWCQDRALYNAIMESINIIDGKHDSLTKNALPDILSKALAVSFDTNIGHDYLEDAEQRIKFLQTTERRIPFDIELLNIITKGGLPIKSLNILLAGPGVGKSAVMCHCAASSLSMGKDVLYITLEMAEERIAERIDANLFDLEIDQIETLPVETYMSKVKKISSKTDGKLIIKEYPTSQAHAGHIRALLNELKLKKNFVPDIVMLDYINLCASSRIKMGSGINSYSYIKAIAEEIRGLAMEFELPILSATQVNRDGFGSSDPDMTNTSESFGLPATADMMLALVTNDQLAADNQIMVKQLKNRYASPDIHKRFVVGYNKSKMKLFDVDQSEQDQLVNDTPDIPVFDVSASGARVSLEKLHTIEV